MRVARPLLRPSTRLQTRRLASTIAILDTSHPGDTRSLQNWLTNNPQGRPRCLLGKTEGNGCVNDFSRGYASHVVSTTLGDRRGDCSIIMSGGTEGVLTPHLLLLADDGVTSSSAAPPPDARLSFGVSRTRDFLPAEIGRVEQVEATIDAVLAACADANLAPSECAFVQIKCPLLTPERLAASDKACATPDGYYSMALSRGASALGVALASGELDSSAVYSSLEAGHLCSPEMLSWAVSNVASASAGIELMHSEVFVLGNAMGSTSSLRAAHTVMADAVDAPAVFRMLESAGLDTKHGSLTDEARGRVKAVLAKADPAASVRGQRTTMLTDSDLNATRHARASVGGLLAGIFGETRLYVSGGAEHQGPNGGGPVCVLYEASS